MAGVAELGGAQGGHGPPDFPRINSDGLTNAQAAPQIIMTKKLKLKRQRHTIQYKVLIIAVMFIEPEQVWGGGLPVW